MDVAERLKTALADRYAIEGEVGAGGMALVYLARDLKHNRKVALKLLRPELGAVLGPHRFLSEIQVTANLQHPHLLPLFDSGEVDGLLFYVMPFVEGESLRERLRRERQLPLEEAVRIGVAVSSALDYAHRHEVVHRDLKPENILLHEGQPLVSDFGIGLAVSQAGGPRVTQTGLSLGTPQYMSPEQATGDRAIDARSDIYSLGAVVYEMLTGEPPHVGTTVQAIIARVLTDPAKSPRALRPTVPEHVEAAVLRALAKLPADRFASAGDFADALSGARPVLTPVPGTLTAMSPAHPAAAPRRRHALRPLAPWLVAGGAAVLAGAAVMFPDRRVLPGPPSLFQVTFSDSVAINDPPGTTVAISPDGTQLLFAGTVDGGAGGLVLRRMEALDAQYVRGTEGALSPSFSPDGQWILFSVGGALRKVPAVGGAFITLADSGAASSWGDRHEVVFDWEGSLYRVSADGGPRTPLARPDSLRGHVAYRWPHVLPGGKAALITLYKNNPGLDNAELGVVTIPAGEVRELGIAGTNPRFTSSGHIIFGRADGSVFAVPFSARRLSATAAAVPVLEGVIVKRGGPVEISVSENGTLVYKGGSDGARRLFVVDRRGLSRPLELEPQAFSGPRVSRDGRRIAVTVASGQNDIWLHDLGTRTLTRITTDGRSVRPDWMPDGKGIAYVLQTEADRAVLHTRWDGSGTPQTFATGAQFFEASFGPAGTYLALRIAGGPASDIWLAPVDSPQARQPLVATPAEEVAPRISPDGRLLAYSSNESGRHEVYVRTIPVGPRVQVSVAGGEEPVWAHDGRELYYRSPTHLMAARIATAPELTVTDREVLFADSYGRDFYHPNYDVLPGDGGFVMVQDVAGGTNLFAVVNWTETLRSRFEQGRGGR